MSKKLSFEVIGAHGRVMRETGLDRVVVRRREPLHDPGSEVAIHPGHAPLLMLAQECETRLYRGEKVRTVTTPPGVLEVYEGDITLIAT